MAEKNDHTPVSVGFIALGCSKNIVDSEKMLAKIVQAGFLITADTESADVVVINTCAFIEPAKKEAIQTIKHAVDCKIAASVKKIIVAGCLPQRLGNQLFNQTHGIDAIVGLEQRDNIAEIIKKTLKSEKPKTFLDHSSNKVARKVHDDRARLLITPQHWAYLRISEGCDHTCSFCTIPAIRGRFRSKPQKNILAEANELVSAGTVELNIIAQDTTYYGRDLKIKNGLNSLLKQLEKIRDLKWIRLMYMYPAGISDLLINTIAESKKILHYVDIPIQHINNEILKNMRRPDSKEYICRLIEKLRAALPDLVLRTTIIVGFPGETDIQFAELLEFVKWAQFDALGAFTYFKESGTLAAEMTAQLPDEIKQLRLDQLMLAQQDIAFEKNKAKIGSEMICLIDSVDSQKNAKGRFYGQAPDIDSICLMEKCSEKPGSFVNTTVSGTKDYDLLVSKI